MRQSPPGPVGPWQVLTLHLSGVEDLRGLTWQILGLLVTKGLLDNVLSDYLWAQAHLLTVSPHPPPPGRLSLLSRLPE